jgi:hypothetical protein
MFIPPITEKNAFLLQFSEKKFKKYFKKKCQGKKKVPLRGLPSYLNMISLLQLHQLGMRLCSNRKKHTCQQQSLSFHPVR